MSGKEVSKTKYSRRRKLTFIKPTVNDVIFQKSHFQALIKSLKVFHTNANTESSRVEMKVVQKLR